MPLLEAIVRLFTTDLEDANESLLGVVDHHLVFVSMTPEGISNDMWRVSVDDLVEVVGRVREWVASIPATKDMTNDPP